MEEKEDISKSPFQQLSHRAVGYNLSTMQERPCSNPPRMSIPSVVVAPTSSNVYPYPPYSFLLPPAQLPQVTISHDGSTTELPLLQDTENPLNLLSTPGSRLGRSQSLTPTVGHRNSFSEQGSSDLGNKIRSNSLTLGAPPPVTREPFTHLRRVSSTEEKFNEGPPEEIELRDWMKSLRLHKYTDRLVGLSQDQLLSLNDLDLTRMGFTDGAKGKFVKQINMVKERPLTVKQLKTALENVTEPRDLQNLLPEMEKIILMPLISPRKKSTGQLPSHYQWRHPPPSLPHSTCGGPVTYDPLMAGAASFLRQRSQDRRHDSGSDSGTELFDDTHPLTLFKEEDEEELDPNHQITQDIFELLEKTFSILICKQQDDRDRDRVVLQFYRLIERRCLKKEAFTAHHKLAFQMWIKRMDQVWDISRNVAEAAIDKRKFDRKYSLDRPVTREMPMRRASIQPPTRTMSVCGFPRGPSPMAFKSQSGGGQVLLPASGMVSPSALTSHLCGFFSDRTSLQHPDLTAGAVAVQRRSVPDINTTPSSYMPIKRNSYQGDQRMPPLIDSEILATLASTDCPPRCIQPSQNSSRRASTLSISSWDSGYSRRNSSMSTTSSECSRRNSDMSEVLCDRRDSQMSGDSGHGFDFEVRRQQHLHLPPQYSHLSVPPPVTSTLAPPVTTLGQAGSVSSGCASDDGSTDSLLEHDLHKLSLAVTEQALLE